MNKIPKKSRPKSRPRVPITFFVSIVTIVGSGHQFSIMDNNAATWFTSKHITAKQGRVNDVSFVFGIFHAGAPATPLEFFKRAVFLVFFLQGVRPLQKIRRVFKCETEKPCSERHQHCLARNCTGVKVEPSL